MTALKATVGVVMGCSPAWTTEGDEGRAAHTPGVCSRHLHPNRGEHPARVGSLIECRVAGPARNAGSVAVSPRPRNRARRPCWGAAERRGLLCCRMARGWESKAIEAQQADAGRSAPVGPPLSEAERERRRQADGLRLGPRRGDRPAPGGVPTGAPRHAAPADRGPRGPMLAALAGPPGPARLRAAGRPARCRHSAFLLCSVSRGLRSVPIPPRVTVATTHPLNIPRQTPVQREGAIAPVHP